MVKLTRLCICLLLFFCSAVFAQTDVPFIERNNVKEFITEMVSKHKFKKAYLTKLFSQVKVRPQVIRHLNRPLEKQPWHLYEMVFVSSWHIQHGVEFWDKYANTLKKAEKVYGVPAAIIVATIGIETKYGERKGDFRVLDSLTNIAFSDSPRVNFFKKELTEFLLLSREQHLDPLKIMGSYAGAIGQPQFMPSSYRHYAVNFSKSGKIDLMNSEVDVIGSIANYYHKNGWKPHGPVAEPALILGDRYHYLLTKKKIDKIMPVSELTNLGVLSKNKIDFEKIPAKVITLQSLYNKEYWLGFHNFDVIKRYNSSDLYAMAVFQLSNYIEELRKQIQAEPKTKPRV